MKSILKWTGLGLLLVLGIAGVVAAVLAARGGARLARGYWIEPAVLAIPTDSAAVARGRHLARAVTLCVGCHGEGLEGDVLVDQSMMATVYASNLTSGQGGVASRYADADWVRAIRHGVNPAGRGLMIMHSDMYHRLSETDLASIIAFVKSVPPADHVVPPTGAAWLGKVFVALGFFDAGPMSLIPAEVIDHDEPIQAGPEPGRTAEYGRYLLTVGLCVLCHGSDLAGGPPVEEGAPAAPNIAVYAGPGGWSESEFLSTIRTGVTPQGKSLDGESMPWRQYGEMTDEELGAIWEYLTSLHGS